MRVKNTEIHFENNFKLQDSDSDRITLYLDVGGKNEHTVFDHHYTNSNTHSTVQILHQPKGKQRLQRLLDEAAGKTLRLVTHPKPDLDAIGACTTVLRMSEGKSLLTPDLVDLISRHDQGYATDTSVEASIPIFLELISRACKDSAAIMTVGISFIELLQTACEQEHFQPGITPLPSLTAFRNRFPKEIRRLKGLEPEYHQTLRQAISFTAPHPTINGESIHGIRLSLSGNTPPGFKSWLKKKMEADPITWGQVLLIRWKDAPAPRVVISCSPTTDIDLQPWGHKIDQLESEQSERLEKSKRDLPHILKGIADHRGKLNDSHPTLVRGTQHPRPGFSNNDPWYDGRGHQGSIIDSPRSGTILTDQEIYHLLDFK